MNKKIYSPNQQLIQFFLLTFLFSWLMWLPSILITYNLITPSQTLITINNVLKWVAGIGPSLTAIILVIKFDGKVGLKKLFKRVWNIKLGYWYFPIILMLPIILVTAHLINTFFFNNSFPKTGLLEEPWWIPVLFVIFFIYQFSEELGWRGYALDRLQKKWNALYSSLLLGCIWGIWHLPMFLSSGFGQHDNHLPFIQFLITLVLLSVWITWFQNNTNNSLIPAFVIHAFINLSGDVLPLIEKNEKIQGNYTAWLILNILLFLSVIAIVFFYGIKKLVRKETTI
ncbi:MAG: type II CAAX endopeptidase family protein [Ignavibacteriales bacterium]|nr:type II CAAX endopeptidase family protein [Ignavibacteriales bacterium]